MSEIRPKTSLSRAAQCYIGAVIVAGLGVTFWSVAELFRQPPSPEWLVLVALTLLTGSFTVKIPGIAARLSVSDAFVFASVLLFGPSAATVIVALDCVVASLWLQAERRSLLRSSFSLSAVALAVWTASQIFYRVSGITPGESFVLPTILVPLFLFASVYFLLNTWLIVL